MGDNIAFEYESENGWNGPWTENDVLKLLRKAKSLGGCSDFWFGGSELVYQRLLKIPRGVAYWDNTGDFFTADKEFSGVPFVTIPYIREDVLVMFVNDKDGNTFAACSVVKGVKKS